MQKHILSILSQVKDGTISVEDGACQLSYEDLGYAKIDHHRKSRTGYPEVIFGMGKTPSQAAEIFHQLYLAGNSVICTRVDKVMADVIIQKTSMAIYHQSAQLVIYNSTPISGIGMVAIATGGTSDIFVAEEAALVLETFGSKVLRLYDVGVAGVHRLLSQQDKLREANCIIAVAGMEGALPSVVSGLVSVPVIAVPTSVGYGANFGGLTPLLAMLCSCAAGVTVVNIDNGFGAAYQADMINKLACKNK